MMMLMIKRDVNDGDANNSIPVTMAFRMTMMVVAIIIISTLKLCYQLFHFEAAISAPRNVE